MPYDLLADAVVAVHFAFVIFVAVGGLLAWRWPTLLLAHIPCVAWGALLVAFGLSCPLTGIERGLRERAGAEFEGGFVSRYLEGVIYPEGFTPHLRALAALAIIVGWGGLALRAFRLRSECGAPEEVPPQPRPPRQQQQAGDRMPAEQPHHGDGARGVASARGEELPRQKQAPDRDPDPEVVERSAGSNVTGPPGSSPEAAKPRRRGTGPRAPIDVHLW